MTRFRNSVSLKLLGEISRCLFSLSLRRFTVHAGNNTRSRVHAMIRPSKRAVPLLFSGKSSGERGMVEGGKTVGKIGGQEQVERGVRLGGKARRMRD